jgi:hypothetical protein
MGVQRGRTFPRGLKIATTTRTLGLMPETSLHEAETAQLAKAGRAAETSVVFSRLPRFDTMTICDTCEEFDIYSFVGAPDGRRGYPLDQTRRRAFATRYQFCELLVAIADQQLRGSDSANPNDLWIHLQFFQGEDESPPSGSRPGARIKRLRVLVTPRYYGLSTQTPPGHYTDFHVAADSCE